MTVNGTERSAKIPEGTCIAEATIPFSLQEYKEEYVSTWSKRIKALKSGLS